MLVRNATGRNGQDSSAFTPSIYGLSTDKEATLSPLCPSTSFLQICSSKHPGHSGNTEKRYSVNRNVLGTSLMVASRSAFNPLGICGRHIHTEILLCHHQPKAPFLG